MAKWLLFQRTWVQVLVPKSQLKTVIPVSEGLTPSSGLREYQAYMWWTDIQPDKTPIQIKINKMKEERNELP